MKRIDIKYNLEARILRLIETGEALDEADFREMGIFLAEIGYLTDEGEVATTQEKISEPISKFQDFFELREQGGVLGKETLQAMVAPRCGVPDGLVFLEERVLRRRPERCRWERNPRFTLTYHILGGLAVLPAAIRGAAAEWSGVNSNGHYVVEFVEVGGTADVPSAGTDAFIKGEHNLKGNLIAHARFPCENVPKVVHFDREEHRWALEAKTGKFNAREVALHELGHILGLRHVKNKNAIMYPVFSMNSTGRPLSGGDKAALRQLYGLTP